MHVLPGIRRIKWVAALAAIVATAETAGSQSAEVGDFFTADVSIGQTHVAADGQRLPGASPSAKYRLEHRAGSGAVTRLTLVELERETAEGATGRVALDNPFLAVRMELDGTGGMRLYNRRGDRVHEPTAADRGLFGVTNPGSGSTPPDTRQMSSRARPSSLLVASGRAGERRAELERLFGAPVERVRGLDRYVTTRRGDVDEALVDPVTALPAELNTVRAGALVSRVQMAYEAKSNGTLVRRWFRAERALADARRVVTTIDVTNVQVVAGGGQ
jgi:hypothetical protein